MICIGDEVLVSPKSQKGKSRILEHGNIWKVKKQWGKRILIETDPENGNGLRWVNVGHDMDFKIEEIKEK